MENNKIFRDGSIKLKQRRMTRAASIAVDSDGMPLSMLPRYKNNAPAAVMVRWRNDPQSMVEEQFPADSVLEYMEVGPSPPAESAPSIYDSFEEPSIDLSVQINADTIRINIIEQMKSSGGRFKLLDDIEHSRITVDNLAKVFQYSTKIERNLALLWAAYLKRFEIVKKLLDIGADLNFCDSNGISALHLAAFSGCLPSMGLLIARGADVNLQSKCYTPLHCAAFGNSPNTAKLLLENGARLATLTNRQHNEDSLLHCAVRANAPECVKLFIGEGSDVNCLSPNGVNAIHLAADLGHSECLSVLLNSSGADPNRKICVREKDSSALHLAADGGHLECISLLIEKGADVNAKNYRGYTPLHLAARVGASVECLEALLRTGGANPNAEDYDNRTPLHTAIGKSESVFDTLETLITWGADVNHKDIYGFTALHLAALDGLAQCVEMLIYHGADVSTKSKKGTSALNVICRKTPASLAMVNHKLDAAITLHQSQDTNREVEVELDFRQILQHCYPREINYLNTFVDEGQKEILQHPLCSAFLYIKWGKIRKYYIGRLVFCFTFVLFLTLYVLTALAHNCYNGSKDMEETIQEQELCQKQSILGDMLRNNPFVMEMQWWVLVAITIFEIFRKLFGITGYSSFRHYVTQAENIIEWFVITSVFVISYIYTNRTYTWQNHIGAFAVLLGWTNLMLMIGQLPVFGAYVAMYTKVQGEFAKLFMAYSCMLVGFTISFCVIFPQSSSFANPFMGFITVLVMMSGEQDLQLLLNDPDGKDPPFLLEISAQITFVLFLLFVTVILMNLLVGIAVHDIQGLKKTAGLSKLVRQTKLISYIESALFNGYLPPWLRNLLHYTALVSPQAYKVVLCVKPLNPGENRLPRDILMAAYEVSRQKRHFGHTISSRPPATSSYFTHKKDPESGKNSENGGNGGSGNGGVVSNGGTIISATTTSASTYPLLINDSVDSDCGFETESVCTLTAKIDDNAEKIDILTNEIRELKSLLHQYHSSKK